jgi:hypothetical protein
MLVVLTSRGRQRRLDPIINTASEDGRLLRSPPLSAGGAFSLLVVVPHIRSFFLSASTAETREEWMVSLREAVTRLEATSMMGYLRRKGALTLNTWTERFYILQVGQFVDLA